MTDTRNTAPLLKGILRKVVGAAGLLLGIFLLVATMLMFHVGLMYKTVAVVWVFLIWRHFLRFFRDARRGSW